jgi:hypothetical protein
MQIFIYGTEITENTDAAVIVIVNVPVIDVERTPCGCPITPAF